jgi:hypothetical protein
VARAATSVLLTGALGLLAACGGHGPRDNVERYIQDVKAVQSRTNPALDRANKTYSAFARGQMRNAAGRERLVSAEKSIRAVRAELARLRPPHEARTLHARLLHYYDASADLAYETTLLGRYEPAAQSALRSLPQLNAGLSRDLGAAHGPGDQVSALKDYNHGLDRVLRALRALRPPPILLAAHNNQLARLEQTRGLAGRLSAALRKQDARAIARLLLRFRKVGSGSSSAVSRLSAAAVRAYDARIRGLATAAGSFERERRRLETTLK